MRHRYEITIVRVEGMPGCICTHDIQGPKDTSDFEPGGIMIVHNMEFTGVQEFEIVTKEVVSGFHEASALLVTRERYTIRKLF